MQKTRKIKRFNLIFRIQHILMFSSVFTLVITAIPMWCLRYPYSQTLTSIIDLFGGLEQIRTLHHAAGWTLTFTFLYHLIYILVHPEGRRDFLLMLPRIKDFRDLYYNILYFIGKRKEPPKFGRFSYFEKFDYWAAYWGCVIMCGTGLIMLYHEKFENKVFYIALEAHYHEAIIAALALFIWHMFNVHFKPEKFPGTLTWLNGNITEEEQKKEHPLEAEEIKKLEI